MKSLKVLIHENLHSAMPESTVYYSPQELRCYFAAAERQLSTEAKVILGYLIDHPETTKEDLMNLYLSPASSETERLLKEKVVKLKKQDRLKELPFYQTREEFDAIVNQEIAIDEIIYDFRTEAGRNKIARQFDDYTWYVARQYQNKSNLSLDELRSAALHGLTQAMNKYANSDYVKTDETGMKNYVPFVAFALQQMRFYVLEDIKNNSHTIHIPAAEQDRERHETGSNTRSFTVSGDEYVSDGPNAKTRFDLYSDDVQEEPTAFSDTPDSLVEKLIKRLLELYPTRKRDIQLFIDAYGLNGSPIVGAELAAKYNIASSNISRIKHDVLDFIRQDKYCMELVSELRTMNESLGRISFDNRNLKNLFE